MSSLPMRLCPYDCACCFEAAWWATAAGAIGVASKGGAGGSLLSSVASLHSAAPGSTLKPKENATLVAADSGSVAMGLRSFRMAAASSRLPERKDSLVSAKLGTLMVATALHKPMHAH